MAQLRFLLLALLPLFCLGNEAELDSSNEDSVATREKRSIFPYVLGETILDIQCRRGSLTVCAPDGPGGCPVGYSSQTNVGVCGFATLNHYLNTSNIAGTCCFKTAGTATGTVTTTTTGRSVLLPQIVAYPVYAQYPYAVASNTNTNTATSAPASVSYASPSSSSYGSSPAVSSYGSPSSSSVVSYGASPSPSPSPSSSPSPSPAAYARQYGSSASYGSPSSSYASPAASSSSASSGTVAAQAVYNPQSLAYPPLLSLTSIPVPNGSLFNPFPPAMNVAVYGSSTRLIELLQTLLAQILGTGAAPANTVSALQNVLVLAMNTPGWTTQLQTSVTAALALAQAIPNQNPANAATISAIQTLQATGTGATQAASASTSSASSAATGSASNVCAGASITLPSLQSQFQVYLTAVKSAGLGDPTVSSLERFVTSFSQAPILNADEVTFLTPLLTLISSNTQSQLIVQSTANLQAGLAAYTTYSANSNTISLLQTLYQLSSTNRNLDPNIFAGLGALVAQTAGLSAVPVTNPPTLQVAIREATRYVAQSFQTPLPQLILAKIINCRVTPGCCTGGAIAVTTAAPSTNYGSASYAVPSPSATNYYASPAGGSSSSYASPSPSPSPSPMTSYAASPASSGYASPSPSPSNSYVASPPSSSSSGYAPSSSSSYGGSSQQVNNPSSNANNSPIIGVDQSATVYSARPNSANSYPAFLPIYPALQPVSGVSSTSSSPAGVAQAIPASNQSAYNYGYPTGLPQYPVLPYYVQAPSPASLSVQYSSSSPAQYAASPAASVSAGMSSNAVYGNSPSYSVPATSAPATAAPAVSYGNVAPAGGYAAPAPVAVASPAVASAAVYGGSASYGSPATVKPVTAAPATNAPSVSYGAVAGGSSGVYGGGYGSPATAAPATAAPATAAPGGSAYGGAAGGASYGSSYGSPATAAPATVAPVTSTGAPGTAAPVTAAPATAAPTTTYSGSSTIKSKDSISTWGPFPMADNTVSVPVKALDQCGIPHSSQQGDIAFLIANGQKGPRANIYRSKRAASDRESRITNSMVAKEMEVCWMAAILLDGKYQSGASIVSEWFVLTAAHEIDGREINRLRIRVGDTDVRQGSLDKEERVGCIQDLAVEKIILHPDFDRKTLSSDIGLIKLKEPINLNSPCICKICLQEEGPQEGETCIISGYGSTRVVDPSKTKTEEDAFALSGPNAEILRYAGIPIVANDVCAAAFKNERLAPRLKVPFGVLDDTQVCAGGISQRDACYGDGGSPLVCFNGRSFYQSGVVSYGRGCGKALMAAVYGSVTAAAPWISEELATQRS